MTTITKRLKDRSGRIVLPQTNAVLVLETNGNVQEAINSLKNDVAYLQSRFKGSYETLNDLEVAHPTGENGDWAIVDEVGENAKKYIWDNTDTKWVLTGITSGVETVNGKSGIVNLLGSDISSTLDVETEPSTKTLTKWLQLLKDDLNNLDASTIQATINGETRTVQDFLEAFNNSSIETIIDLKNETNFEPYLESGKRKIIYIPADSDAFGVKTVYAFGLSYMIEETSNNPLDNKGYTPYKYSWYLYQSGLGYAIKETGDRYGFSNSDDVKLEVDINGYEHRLKISLSDTFLARINGITPKETPLTLLSADWVENELTFSLIGTDLEDLENQKYTLDYVIENREDFINAGIYIKSATLNQIVFACDETPTTDISIRIIYQKGGN